MAKRTHGVRRRSGRPSPIPTADRQLRRELAQLRAFEAVSHMRKRGLSLAHAAREVGETPRRILQLAGSALRKNRKGRYVARTSDQVTRPMEILTRDGKVTVRIRGSKAASVIGSHWNAVKDFLEGRPTALRQFRGKEVRAGRHVYRLLTDPGRLQQLGGAGEVSFESIYALTR